MALHLEFQHRSKRVRVTPAMTMFQVVDAARAEFNLDASAALELLHRGRPVDLSTPFRLTGISNNATLELRALAPGSDVQRVRVALQLLDGRRVQETFANDTTLAAILDKWSLLGDDFSLNFLQREITNDAFATTALRDLGVVSGSAMFRVQKSATGSSSSAISPPSAVATDSSNSILPAPIVSPPAPAAAAASIQPATAVTPSFSSVSASSFSTTAVSAPAQDAPVFSTVAERERKTEDVEMVDAPAAPVASMSGFDALQLLRDSCFDVVSRTAIITLMKIVTNLLSYPDNEKLRSIRVSNAAFHRNVGQHRGGIEFLLSLGFVLDKETEALSLSVVDSSSRAALEDALRLLQKEADDLSIDESERPKIVVPATPDPSFDAFKPQITRMQMQPRGASTTEVLVDTLKSKQEQLLQSAEKPPRNPKVLFPGETGATTSAALRVDAEAEDERPGDLALVMASMKARRSELEKAQNFRTQAMRELDELKRKKVFQSTLIRVQFSDRVSIQVAFHPLETVADVMAYIRDECLDASVSENKFYLYVSPPLVKLDPTKTLTDMGLVPAAHTYLSWIDALPASSSSTVGAYLRQELLTSVDAESKNADDGRAAAYPKPVHLDEQAAAEEKKTAAAAAAQAAMKRAGSESKGKSGKRPAWLKL
ncbi:hypothetical protein PINS_up001664 [Pythium insidiosum]|nr:hypothetical protein PINS_up001664 [Pythium insidiosum]